MPASAHNFATVAACTSEPPASTSARSRQDRRWIRRRPAAAAGSPIFAMLALLPADAGAATSWRVVGTTSVEGNDRLVRQRTSYGREGRWMDDRRTGAPALG